MPYSAEAILGTGASASVNFDRAVIESVKPDGKLRTHVFRTDREISRVQRTQPGVPFPIVGIQERNISDRWLEIEI